MKLKNILFVALPLCLLFGCENYRIQQKVKWIRKQAQEYVSLHPGMDETVRQNILAGKITIGMLPEEAVAAGGPFHYVMQQSDGEGMMASIADIRYYFEWHADENKGPPSWRIPPDILWMQKTNPATNLVIKLTFWNRTQFDTKEFVNTRVLFEEGRVSSIEKLGDE